MPDERLIVLYQEMAELTRPECASQCRVPLSCCDEMYCKMTKQYASEVWGVELEETNHGMLPFMGPNGCVVAPHLRPLCSLHTCKINGIGTSGRPEWDKKYFELRERIEELEFPDG